MAIVALAAPATAGAAKNDHDLLRAMNITRAAHRLAPLKAQRTLGRAARAHSGDMLRRNLFGHYGFVQRMKRFKIRGPFVGENLAWGVGATASPNSIVASWLASPQHRANLLNPRFRNVGIGTAVGSFAGRSGAVVVTANFAGS